MLVGNTLKSHPNCVLTSFSILGPTQVTSMAYDLDYNSPTMKNFISLESWLNSPQIQQESAKNNVHLYFLIINNYRGI